MVHLLPEFGSPSSSTFVRALMLLEGFNFIYFVAFHHPLAYTSAGEQLNITFFQVFSHLVH